MTIFAVSLLFLSVVLTVYALWGRDRLKSKPWAAPFFAWIEPIEIALFKKSSVILFARLKMFSGVLLTLLTSFGEINLSPFMPFVPEKYQPWVNGAVNLMPLILTFVGWMDEKLRNATTLPIQVVAVPEKVIAENPTVAATVAEAVSTNTVAIAAIAEAKAV